MDKNHEALPPEQARALDALIASHTDTSLDEAQADRLLSFLTDGSRGSYGETGPDQSADAGQTEIAGAAELPASEWTGSEAGPSRSLALRAAIGLGLGFAAAAVFYFVWFPRRTRPEERSGVQKHAPLLADKGAPPIVEEDGSRGAKVPGAASAIRVRGAFKKSHKPVDRDRNLMAAWQGQWVPDLQLSELRQATREACAAAYPWPLSEKARFSGSSPLSTAAQSFGTACAMLPSHRLGSTDERAVIATRWLLRRVADGTLPMSELHVPGRVLIASRGLLRRRLVALFRESGVRLERLAWMRGRRIPAQTAELLAAVGVEASIKHLAQVDAGLHGTLVRQVLFTASACGDTRSLGFLVDFLVLAHRRQPISDGIRMAPLADLEGVLWKRFVEVVSRQATQRARYPDRLFLESLRTHLTSRT